MRILQLGRYYPPHMGGIETVIYEITEGLAERGVKCDVLCSNKDRELVITQTDSYKITRTASYGSFLSTSITPQLYFQLKKNLPDYDIIHLHHPDPTATVALLLCNPKQKVVIHWHSDIVRQKYTFLLFKPLQELILKRCNAIIVTSENYLEGSDHLRNYTDKAEIIPIGIQPVYKRNDDKLLQLKNRFHNKKIIFALGRHVYYKGFEYLIESAKHLDNSYRILIGGSGPLSESYRQKIDELDVSDVVHLMGTIPDEEITPFYELSDILCLPSVERSEAFGVVLLEAMSFGKPIVATKIPGSGVSWVNQDHKTGINVETKNPRELAEAFKKIYAESNLRNSFEKQSKLRYQEHFTREAMIGKLVHLYKKIMKDTGEEVRQNP